MSARCHKLTSAVDLWTLAAHTSPSPANLAQNVAGNGHKKHELGNCVTDAGRRILILAKGAGEIQRGPVTHSIPAMSPKQTFIRGKSLR